MNAFLHMQMMFDEALLHTGLNVVGGSMKNALTLLIITVVDWKYFAHIVYLERICFVYLDYIV